MILGRFEYTIDQKGRLAIPAKIRGQFKAGLVLCGGFRERCIRVLPTEVFNSTSEKLLALPDYDEASRRLQRERFANACDTELDGQGRVLLPQWLRDYAGITDSAIVTGLHFGLEIWSPENWENEAARMGGSVAQAVGTSM